MGLAAAALAARRTGSYERHRPETTTLYAVVRDNVETLYAAVAAGFGARRCHRSCGVSLRATSTAACSTPASSASRVPSSTWQEGQFSTGALLPHALS